MTNPLLLLCTCSERAEESGFRGIASKNSPCPRDFVQDGYDLRTKMRQSCQPLVSDWYTTDQFGIYAIKSPNANQPITEPKTAAWSIDQPMTVRLTTLYSQSQSRIREQPNSGERSKNRRDEQRTVLSSDQKGLKTNNGKMSLCTMIRE